MQEMSAGVRCSIFCLKIRRYSTSHDVMPVVCSDLCCTSRHVMPVVCSDLCCTSRHVMPVVCSDLCCTSRHVMPVVCSKWLMLYVTSRDACSMQQVAYAVRHVT
jgi:hypothetical protein